MKRRIFKISIVMFLSFIGTKNVFATSASISVSTTSAPAGSSGSATLTVSSNEHIGQIYGTFSCGRLGSKDLTYVETSSPPTSKVYTISWTNAPAGTHTCSVSGLQVGLLESAASGFQSIGTNTPTIVISANNTTSNNNNNKKNNNNKQNTTVKKETKSNNTKLEEFGVKDYKISPDFSNDKNDYTLTVPYDVNKIEIYATRSSDKQKVTGTGEKELKEGENKFEIVVTAEDGTRRTINLTVNVDSKPIVVKVDGNDYTVIKKKEELPKLDIEHEDMTLTIEEQEIPAYRIDKIGYVLVGLKDSEGNINLYKFDSFKNDEKEPEYHLFKYLKSTGILFIRLDFPKNKIPKNYKKYTETINDEKVEVYKLSKNSKYSLIYGLNVETGKENIYRYNSEENTLQLFEREEVKKIEEKVVRREKLIMILGGVIFILIILTTIGFTRHPKNKADDFFTEEKEEDTEKLTKKDIKRMNKENKKIEKENKKKLKKGDFDM